VTDLPTWQRWTELLAALASAGAAAVAAIYAARTVRDFRVHSQLTALQDARKAALEAKEYAHRVTEGFPLQEWRRARDAFYNALLPLAGTTSPPVWHLQTRRICKRSPKWDGTS
jgi:hypothetical protein